MTQYKGYYIDHIFFHSKDEIDAHIKQQAVEKFKMLNKFFAERPDMGVAQLCDEQAERLHDIFGFSWEEIEEMEIADYAA